MSIGIMLGRFFWLVGWIMQIYTATSFTTNQRSYTVSSTASNTPFNIFYQRKETMKMLRNELFRFIAYRLEGKGWDDIPTIYGITQKFYPQSYNRIKSLVDNGASKELIDDAIMDAYNQIYEKSGAGKLWHPLNWVYFDFYFNSGKNAGIILQETFNEFVGYKAIETDGGIGSETTKAVNKFKGNLAFVGFYILNRIKFYMSINNKKYLNGWINRTIKLAKYIYREVS